MTAINGSIGNYSSSATSKLASTRSTAKESDVSSAVPFNQILQASMATQKASAVMSDFDIKALTQSGTSPQEVAEAFKTANVNIYDIARATGSNVDELRQLASDLGMDYIDPYKNNPVLSSAMDKLSNNSGGFTRIGVDVNGALRLQTAGSGGIFGWQNMDQIRMSNGSLPGLVQDTAGGPGLFKNALLSEQEVNALKVYMPQANDTTVKYSTGGYPTAWSQREWNAGLVQNAYASGQPGYGLPGFVLQA